MSLCRRHQVAQMGENHDFFASTPLNGLSQYGTIPSDVDLKIGVVVMRRMSFALGGGKRFPPLLYIRHAKEQASAEHFC